MATLLSRKNQVRLSGGDCRALLEVVVYYIITLFAGYYPLVNLHTVGFSIGLGRFQLNHYGTKFP